MMIRQTGWPIEYVEGLAIGDFLEAFQVWAGAQMAQE